MGSVFKAKAMRSRRCKAASIRSVRTRIYPRTHPDLSFYVTRIGCGIAGFRDEETTLLFADARERKNVCLPESFAELISSQ